MPRFFAPKENIKSNLIYIDGQEARHILNVMRLKENDKVIIFDGTGKEYTGFIKQARPKSVTVEIISTRVPKIDILPAITLAQAIPKKEKMDYIVEKATELGVHSIIPLVSERAIVRFESDKAVDRLARWKKIAIEAAKQCGRTDVPEIKDIQKFYNVVDDINKFDMALMACLSEGTVALKEAVSDFKAGKIIIFIGPEGDFTPEEILMAEDTSCKFISLGKRVLKSDTAGLFLLSVLSYEFSR
ncbi:MAG: 16S rRNA (uracil(1498)-N(3))-methyltransferase [Candidatus Omnitrophota bacterium]|nr:MAG: 16S rRNA (uracil(1498)-N(3))-methyltransferase [Candidatus Omnitrophota bacterium]